MNTEKRIGFACALGAFIGALFSLEFAKHFEYGKYLWSVGAFIGGLVGYVSYQFKEIVAACREQEKRQQIIQNLRPAWNFLVNGSLVVVCIFLGILLVTLNWMLFLSTLFFSGVKSGMLGAAGPLTDAITTVSAVGGVSGFMCFMAYAMIWHVERKNEDLWDMTYSFIRNFNPLGLIWHSLSLLYWIAVRVPWFISQCMQFAQGVFIHVHSDIRTICFVDSVIGATIGYFSGNALIGAVVGAILGVVNYRLVSVRWLKLCPKT
ncbi:MAG: hypothetical protein RLZZ347_720 [Candidatus Parcubacteria bacterium]|jgi:hypothetical protein